MTKADEDAIREIELRFNEAWGRHDADAMVETLADDAQFVTVNGAWTTTRADYLNLMQRLHGSDGPFVQAPAKRQLCMCAFSRQTWPWCIPSFTYMAILKNLCALGLVRASCARLMVGGGPYQSRTPTYAQAEGIRWRYGQLVCPLLGVKLTFTCS